MVVFKAKNVAYYDMDVTHVTVAEIYSASPGSWLKQHCVSSCTAFISRGLKMSENLTSKLGILDSNSSVEGVLLHCNTLVAGAEINPTC